MPFRLFRHTGRPAGRHIRHCGRLSNSKNGASSRECFEFNDPIYFSIQFVQHLNIYQTGVCLFVWLQPAGWSDDGSSNWCIFTFPEHCAPDHFSSKTTGPNHSFIHSIIHSFSHSVERSSVAYYMYLFCCFPSQSVLGLSIEF